jgi:hypothetical protein
MHKTYETYAEQKFVFWSGKGIFARHYPRYEKNQLARRSLFVLETGFYWKEALVTGR